MFYCYIRTQAFQNKPAMDLRSPLCTNASFRLDRCIQASRDPYELRFSHTGKHIAHRPGLVVVFVEELLA